MNPKTDPKQETPKWPNLASADPGENLRELVRRWDDGGFYEIGHEDLVESARKAAPLFEAMRDALEAFEWTYDRWFDEYQCPICERIRHLGHTKECSLGALLAKVKEAE